MESWLHRELSAITAEDLSEDAVALFLGKALAKAREKCIPAYDLAVLLTNAALESGISIIEDAWVECGCRYAEMIIRLHGRDGAERTVRLQG